MTTNKIIDNEMPDSVSESKPPASITLAGSGYPLHCRFYHRTDILRPQAWLQWPIFIALLLAPSPPSSSSNVSRCPLGAYGSFSPSFC